MEIIKYKSSLKNKWNNFISKSYNGSFLFNRNYMDYHNDIFEDHSIIIEDNHKWLAVLPGNINGSEWTSHSGLSYGGLISGFISQRKTLKIISKLLIYFKAIGVQQIKIKLIPDIYCRYKQQSIHFALFNLGFGSTRTYSERSSVILLKIINLHIFSIKI